MLSGVYKSKACAVVMTHLPPIDREQTRLTRPYPGELKKAVRSQNSNAGLRDRSKFPYRTCHPCAAGFRRLSCTSSPLRNLYNLTEWLNFWTGMSLTCKHVEASTCCYWCCAVQRIYVPGSASAQGVYSTNDVIACDPHEGMIKFLQVFDEKSHPAGQLARHDTSDAVDAKPHQTAPSTQH